jgi:hypothetical protein
MKLQATIIKIDDWEMKWRIKINQSKHTHYVHPTQSKLSDSANGQCCSTPQNEVKYLGMNTDRRLTWTKHIKTQRNQLNLKTKQILWLLGRRSTLSIESKFLPHKAVLKPIWIYGIQLWGTVSNSNIEVLQRFQSEISSLF